MPFKVAHDRWLKEETDRVESFILMPKFWRKRWTDQSLKQALLDIGLNYSMPEIREINDELHHRGIVEDIGE